MTDNLGNIHPDKDLHVGDVFGEMAIYPGEVSPVTTIAEEDVELVVIPAAEIVRLIQINPNFSVEIIRFIEEHRKAIDTIKGIVNSDDLVSVKYSPT